MASTPPDPPPSRANERPPDAPPGEGGPDAGPAEAFGAPPSVVGRDAIKARAFARLFGGEPPEHAAADVSMTEGRTPTDAATPPSQIGRFAVTERLGGGGMGVVWAAWDPELARRVAIKVLRPDLEGAAGSVGHARLLREAQAMARISHPHVIAVHEVGSLGDQVFIAMEFVEGTTLAGWLASARRSWREILGTFLAAGDGIAAAHAAGVVHRDFKPDNVLIGTDARVRVVDFGLARQAGELASPIAPNDAPTPAEGTSTLTRTGALMGTPAYMSPEQWLGRPADARSDQFSFCVALFEALYGMRPFAGSTIPDLAHAVTSGTMLAPGEVRLPRFVQSALRRGLSRSPDDRFPAMTDLLDALRRDPAVWWRRAGLAGGVAIAASAATWWFTHDDDAHGCDAMAERLVGVWDDAARERVHAAITATGAPFAERTWESAAALLDADARTWVDAAGGACIASSTAGGGDPRRERCLDTRLAELLALTDLLGQADIGIALQAVDAAARLPDPNLCADPRRLAAYREPTDPEKRDQAASARAALGRAAAAGAVGHFDEAIAQSAAVVTTAGELDDPALEAAALLVRGQNELAAGEASVGEQSLRAAVVAAELAEDHATRAQALTQLVFLVGQDPARFAEARALGADASAVLRTIGADPLMRAHLDGALGVAEKRGGELALALQHHRAALAALRELYGDEHPATLRALGNLANTLQAQQRDDEAEPMLEQATRGLEKVLGDAHPAVATSLSNLAITVASLGRAAEAVALMRRSLAIRERNDPGHPSIALGHFNLARALYQTRNYAEALAEYREGLALRGENPVDAALGQYWAGIGRSAYRLGQVDAARDALDRALTIALLHAPAKSSAIRVELARCLLASDPDRARTLVDATIRELADRAPSPETDALRIDAQATSVLVDAVVLARRTGRVGALRTLSP